MWPLREHQALNGKKRFFSNRYLNHAVYAEVLHTKATMQSRRYNGTMVRKWIKLIRQSLDYLVIVGSNRSLNSLMTLVGISFTGNVLLVLTL